MERLHTTLPLSAMTDVIDQWTSVLQALKFIITLPKANNISLFYQLLLCYIIVCLIRLFFNLIATKRLTQISGRTFSIVSVFTLFLFILLIILHKVTNVNTWNTKLLFILFHIGFVIFLPGFNFKKNHRSQYNRGRDRLFFKLFSTTSTRFTDS